MARKFLTPLDLASLVADPASAGFNGGELYFLTTDKTIRMFDGTSWVTIGRGGFSSNFLTPNQASIEESSAGWAADTNCNIARVTTTALHGVAALAITPIAAGGVYARTSGPGPAGTEPVRPNTPHTALVSIGYQDINASSLTCRVLINWYDISAAFISQSVGPSVLTDTDYQQMRAWAVSPANAAYAIVYVEMTGTAGPSDVHTIDCAGLFEGFTDTWTLPIARLEAANTFSSTGVQRIRGQLAVGPEPATIPGVAGDIIANRGGASPGSGAVFFGSNPAAHYIYFDGGQYQFTDGLYLVGGIIDLPQVSTPTAPTAGRVKVYPKSDKKLYMKDSTGVETDLTSTGNRSGLRIYNRATFR